MICVHATHVACSANLPVPLRLFPFSSTFFPPIHHKTRIQRWREKRRLAYQQKRIYLSSLSKLSVAAFLSPWRKSDTSGLPPTAPLTSPPPVKRPTCNRWETVDKSQRNAARTNFMYLSNLCKRYSDFQKNQECHSDLKKKLWKNLWIIVTMSMTFT